MYHKIDIKPKSLNNGKTIKYVKVKGQKNSKAVIVKTDQYKQYCNDMFYLIPRPKKAYTGKLKLYLIVCMSNEGMDTDNVVKASQDAIALRYKFNDKQIYLHDLMKIVVPKGQEFIAFKVESVQEGEYEKKVDEVLAMLGYPN